MATHRPNSYLSLGDKLNEMEEKYKGTDKIFSSSLMTFPYASSSSRLVMFNAHLTQYVNPNRPEIPRVRTGYEKVFGQLSTKYRKTKSNYKVVGKVPRFSKDTNHLYTIFLYNEDEDSYEVIEKQNFENLTEKYGFMYNNEIMDSFEVNDHIEKGTLITRSTSYDKDLNYGYGRNLNVMHLASTNTIEDAIVISDAVAQDYTSTEIESVNISLNDNDILGNLYGDNDNYKVLPDIGEHTMEGVLANKKRIINKQILFDLKKNNLRKIDFNADTTFYCKGIVEDIIIYHNKPVEDPIYNRPFYTQLKEYMIEQDRYYNSVYELAKFCIDSGKKCSKDINYLFKRSQQILDPGVEWREDDSSYSNMKIEVTIYREAFIDKGNKLTGRYGKLIAGYYSNVIRALL